MSTFIADLKQQLRQEDWPTVVAALRNEATLWECLQDPAFARRALEAAGAERQKWSPAFLGLLTLGQTEQFDILRAAPMQALPEALRYKAASFYEELASGTKAEESPDLENATLIAITLRERRRLLTGWEQLANDLSIAPAAYWELPLAILLGLIPSPQELLSTLISTDQNIDLQLLGLRALLSNPLSVDEQGAHLMELIENIPLPGLLVILRQLSKHSSPLAKQVALHALKNMRGERQAGTELSQIEELLLRAEIHQISGQKDQAIPLLSSAWEASKKVQEGLAAQLADSADGIQALDSLHDLADLACAGELRSGPMPTKRPTSLISAAKVALKSGDTKEAETLARAALESAEKEEDGTGLEHAKIFQNIAEVLFDLGLKNDALVPAQKAVEAGPNDSDSAAFLAASFEKNGELGKALDAAHLAAALGPQDPGLRGNLARLLQITGNNEGAVKEWKVYLGINPQPGYTDFTSLAQCALETADIGACIQACQQAITIDASNGAAYALLGRALILQGDDVSAETHLRRAVDLAPSDTGAWKALAKLYKTRGEHQTALDLLINAEKLAGPSAEFCALLADIYATLNDSAKAIASYERARKLALESAKGKLDREMALRLGSLQMQSGESDRAYDTFSDAHNRYPSQPEIAHSFAKLLLKRGENKRALAALQVAHKAAPENPEVLMDLAKALLADNQANAAESVLKNLVAMGDTPLEARVMLAETLASLGKHKEAVKEFSTAMTSDPFNDPAWSKRLALGKARSQIQIGETRLAIKSLEEIAKADGKDLEVLKSLCVAYSKTGHREKAVQLAKSVYSEASHDEPTLLWFADQAITLGMVEDAIKALNKAIESGFQTVGAIQKLAEFQWSAGDHKSALRSFSKLLKKGSRDDLLGAARFMLSQGASKESIPYFERALQGNQLADADLLSDLVEALSQSAQWEKALGVTEQLVSLSPHNPTVLVQKAHILKEMGRPQAALETMERALSMDAENAELLLAKARLLAQVEDWETALLSIEKAIALKGQPVHVIQLAAELALTVLQPERAAVLVTNAIAGDDIPLEFSCLLAELALHKDQELEAAKALSIALQIGEQHPRVIAMQSRLATRHHDFAQAQERLSTAFGILNNDSDLFTRLAVAQAAEDLNDWERAVEILKRVAPEHPRNPLVQFALGKAIVLKTEWEQLLEAAGAKHVDSTVASLPKEGYAECKSAFNKAHKAITTSSVQNLLSRWKTRADLRMAPDPDLNSKPSNYPANGAEAAALVFATSRASKSELVETRCKNHLNDPATLTERAISISAHDAKSASELIETAADALLHSAPVQAIAAKIAQSAGNTEIALHRISRTLALWPKEAKWHALAAEIQHSVGSVGIAIEHLRQAVHLEPGEAEFHYDYGQLQKNTGSFSEAIESLQKAVELRPNETKYQIALAEAYLSAGELKEAADSARKAQKLSPKNPGAFIVLAQTALRNHDPKEARVYIEEALKLNPKDPFALSLFAEALKELGLADDALEILERARSLADDGIPFLIRKAQILGESEGLEMLIKLSQRFPNRGDVFFALSKMIASAGNLKDAIYAAQQGIKKAGRLLDADSLGRLHLHLAQLLKTDGQLDQSLHLLDEAIRMAPYMLDAQVERGRVFLARRQFTEAIDAYKQAAERAPHEMKPHWEAGLALKEAKDYAGAEAELRKAAHLAPTDPQVQRQLAAVIALNMVHKTQEAGVAQ
ncbi:MAG: tetratricopeptide repeat protein [Anaerolineales bacterium]